MRQDIEQALKKFEVGTFGIKGDLKRLEEKIDNDESVIYISPTNATITTTATRKVEKLPGVFALTSRRIVFIYNVLLSHSMLTFDLSEIKSVNCHGNGLTGGHVEILTMVNAIDILVKYKKHIIQEIQKSFDNAISNHKENSQPNISSKDDVLAQIEKLSELNAKGILNEEEYSTKKEELLKRL